MGTSNKSPESVIWKPELNRKQLQRHSIEFIEKVSSRGELDTWLHEICYTVTLLQGHFQDATREAFKRDLDQFHRHGQDRDDADEQGWCLEPDTNSDYLQRENYTTCAVEEDHLKPENCQKALEALRRCHVRNENEEKWTQELCEHVFWDFFKTNGGSTSYEQKLNGWELHKNVLWNEFPEWARLDPSIARLTQPKPDLTYGFPVILPDKEAFGIFEVSAQRNSFSLPVLEQLRTSQNERLISTPTTGLYNSARKKKGKALEAKDLMCFPWAIIEVKRGTAYDGQKAEARDHAKRAEFCYCQAANASAAGLTLREDLAARAKDTSNLNDARVMFSFTCVGSAVKLWLTYRNAPVHRSGGSHEQGGIVMVCIWATSLELSWGIIALRMIVKNVQAWVLARVKPEISRWIQDVYRDRNRVCSLTPSGDVVKQRRRAVSCGTANETTDFASPVAKRGYRTPREKERPSLPHGYTAPESRDKRRAKASIPQVRLNGVSEPVSDDEGYASVHPSAETKKKPKKLMSPFICDDEPSEDDPDASYVPPSSKDESDGSGDEDEEYILSGSESDWVKAKARRVSRLEVYCTPTKGGKVGAAVVSKERREKRRSSRF